MPVPGVPTVDISVFDQGDAHQRAALARVIDDTFTRIGFMTIVGHGVPTATIEGAETAAHQFFALPLEQKIALAKTDQILNRGYIPVGGEAVGRTYGGAAGAPPDLKEAFVVGRLEAPPEKGGVSHAHIQFAPNVWPDQPPAFRERVARYYGELEKLAFRLMRIFASALRLPEPYFEPFFAAHNAVMRLQHYPAQEAAPLEGQLRIGAHTDYGAFTILKGDDRVGGLQVFSKDGSWVDVAPRTEGFVINIGDLMRTWTNDRWQSNLHRVINPRLDSADNIDRLTIPFFVNPNYDARIECLPTCVDPGSQPIHPPMLAGEHRMNKLKKSA
jgi:isopenicillin N synthase-like dioxygenase